MRVRGIVALLLCALATTACDRRNTAQGDEVVTRFTLVDKGGVRKRLIVNGVPIRGGVTVVDRGESTFVNGLPWLPQRAQRTSRPIYSKLDTDDSLRMLRIPYIARRAPRAGPLLPLVNDYMARRQESAFEALGTYKRELNRTGDTARAVARARDRFDREIFVATAEGEHAPTFDCCGVTFYSHGFGSEVFQTMGPPRAYFGDPNAVRGPTLKRALTEKGITTVVWLGDFDYVIEGDRAGRMAADQIDAMLDPDTLRGNRRLAEMIQTYEGIPRKVLSRLREYRSLRDPMD